MTVKAFIKSEEKKRSKDTEVPSALPVEPIASAVGADPTSTPALGQVEAGAPADAPNGITNYGEMVPDSHPIAQDVSTSNQEVCT